MRRETYVGQWLPEPLIEGLVDENSPEEELAGDLSVVKSYFASPQLLSTKPAMRPPMIGATQNSQSCCSGPQSAAKNTVAVERAGLSEVLAIGIDMMCISVNVRPMATGARA